MNSPWPNYGTTRLRDFHLPSPLFPLPSTSVPSVKSVVNSEIRGLVVPLSCSPSPVPPLLSSISFLRFEPSVPSVKSVVSSEIRGLVVP